MTKQEIFHRQLINSYVKHVATTPTEEFLVRSELIRRTREFLTGMMEWDNYEKASSSIFFNGDLRAYHEHLEMALIEEPAYVYEIETYPYGDTTLKSVSI
ncbi:hypothetical protein DRD23_09165 [Salmonella enterica subsp. enterica serovar Enteritidis]|nr:hypothetical protein [Salmonella enterica subsp. enterica serovar Enteritidis]